VVRKGFVNVSQPRGFWAFQSREFQVLMLLGSLMYVLFFDVMRRHVYLGLIHWTEIYRRFKYGIHYCETHSQQHIYVASDLCTCYGDTPLESRQECCLP
jgi:hypothetical protein